MITNASELRVASILAHVTIFELFDRLQIAYGDETTHQMWCPFHPDERPGGTPSARVYAEQNVIFCFTCQKRWDVIAAVQDHFGLPFSDALGWLEQEFAVPGGVTGLMGTVKTKLLARPAPDASVAADVVEATLRAHREKLGYEQYTRCCAALDLTLFESKEKKIKAPEVQQRLQRILQVAYGR